MVVHRLVRIQHASATHGPRAVRQSQSKILAWLKRIVLLKALTRTSVHTLGYRLPELGANQPPA